ncbi:hypothetical protein CK203_070556 [Vitis vinifera]|uniref:MBD domain-containing protein n=1 Tax=Vitis vinifera TaxID=29760 RepID=A0A438FAV0_VITVI|nr:hypothetical protein CK203_070556 [Vitis vinifera]
MHTKPLGRTGKVPAVASDNFWSQPETKAGHKGRLHDERPSWLPPDWHGLLSIKVQRIGKSNKFQPNPMGNRFRSKKKVLSFLQTEVLPRRTANKNPNPAMANGVVREVDGRRLPAQAPGTSPWMNPDFADLPQKKY